MKYTDSALSGGAGLQKHIIDMNQFLADPDNVNKIKQEMAKVFNTKVELGLLKGIKKIQSFSDTKPEFILILANHDPAKSVLNRELKGIINSADYKNFCDNAELKVAAACFMGYGLYGECIYPVDKFLDRYVHVVK